MSMPGRKYEAQSGYRYGFNGKEKDKDISEGDLDFGARIYDGRIGRWLSLDPLQKKYPGETHYGYVSDNPIIYADMDGRDKIYTLTTIDKDGKTHITTWSDKDVFVYTYVDLPGFGNDKYYKQDIISNITIDLRGDKNKVTYTEDLGDRKEISAASYHWNKITEYFGKEGPRGSQAGGISFTSEFSSNGDGPKTDAIKGSDGSVNLDLITVALNAVQRYGGVPKSFSKDMQEWVDQAKELVEQTDNTKDKPSAPTKSNTKPEPVRDTIEKGPSGVMRDPNTKKVTQYSTKDTKIIPSNNKKTPDTIRTIKYQKPKG